MSHEEGRVEKFDPTGKLGRAVFMLVDASAKMHVDIRTRVVRIRNAVQAGPADPMVRFKIDPDLSALMKESRLNPIVRAIRKAMPR